MTITQEDFQKAKRISAAIQEFLFQTGMNDARSTDVYETLARLGLIEKDRHQGFHFRKFLYRLKDANVLTQLIPQCSFTPNYRGDTEWRFNLSNKRIGIDQKPGKIAIAIHQPLLNQKDILLLIEEERGCVERLSVRTDKVYTPQELSIKKNYPRAYEYWTNTEYLILERVYLKCKNVDAVAKLLQRQPHIVRDRLVEKRLID